MDADAICDGGDLGCGELLILLMKRMKELQPGQVLLAITTDPGAVEDLPAWCRLQGHELLRMGDADRRPGYWIRKGGGR